jgi:membrane-bound lytic murein transglycosylase D
MVDAGETLGHFAEWLEVPTQRLRDLNDISGDRALAIGQRIELDFHRIGPKTFLLRRMEYHKGVEEDFFGSWRVTGTLSHRLRSGESLWLLSKKKYRVPIWLIHRYNPDADLTRLVPGSELQIPVVERVSDS